MDDRTFERIVRQAIEGLPDQFKDALENIDIVIEDFPDPDELEEMDIDSPLLGLYQGTPLPERELGEVDLPDKISLYKGEFERMGIRGKELVEEIRITVLHEIGHYFGLDDEAMEEMGY
jgi:predicted Zn-dependent protease with MMP-like domain